MTYQTTNYFDVTRQDGTHTAANEELVVSDGGTITPPTPTTGETFGVRALRNDVTLVPNNSFEGSTNDRRIDAEGNAVFVSDGTEWYLVSGEEHFGFDIPDGQNLYARWDAKEETFSDGATGVSPTDQASTFDATGGNGVEFTTSGQNGHNAYVFNGDDYAVVPNSTTDFNFLHDGSGGSVYVVTSIDTNNISDFDLMLSTGGFNGAGVAFGMGDSSGVLYKINNTGGNTGGGTRDGLIYEAHYSETSNYDTDYHQFEDNVNTVSTNETSSADNAIDNLTIGAKEVGSNYFDGEILAILIYNVQHDHTIRSKVYSYLNGRYS